MNQLSAAQEFRVVDPSKPVKIRFNLDDKHAEKDLLTVPALMKRTAENYANHTALMYQDEVTKEWNGISYKEYRDRVEKMAKVFIKLGLKRHGTVAVLAFNSVEWFVSELAAIHAGGIIAGVYTTNSVDSSYHILKTSKANIVVVDDAKQMEKIHEIKDKLPNLKAVIQTMSPYAQYMKNADGYWRWSELEAMNTDDVEEEFKKRASQIVANECCCLVYTSGTVGMPKGVMISHDNFTCSMAEFFEVMAFQQGNERFVSYMPLSHVAAQVAEILHPLGLAGTVYFADRDAMKGSLVKTLQVARPTYFFGVSRVFEKLQEKIMASEAQAGVLQRALLAWAKDVTLQHHLNRMSGRPSNSIQFRLAEKFVKNNVKTLLGFQECRRLAVGAAPMTIEAKHFFLSLNMPLQELFGMSESAGVHCANREDFKNFDSVGKALIGMQTKIINADENVNGEICLRGRHIFMGYIGEMEKTIEAIDDDGWLRTGDVGYIDNDGYIYITGRIKELIITAGGENIPPVPIENLLKSECTAISNAMLIGDKRKFLTMLVTLKTEIDGEGKPRDELTMETLKWLEGLGLKYTKLSEVLAAGPDPKVSQAIQEAVNRANKSSVSNAQKIQKFAILPHDFSIPTGEFGPTMKLKRNFVVEKYSEIIEKCYK